MGLFDKLFGKKEPTRLNLPYALFNSLNGYMPVYTSHDGSLYELGLCKASIHRTSSECSKAKARLTKSSKRIDFIVNRRPNEFMSASQFYYRLATIFEIENNAFIVPIEDEYGQINGLFPVCPSQVQLAEKDNVVYIVYSFLNGEQKAIEYSRCGHLKKMQYKDDFFGDSNSAFNNTADLVKADEQGTNEAITNGSRLRFKGKLNQQVIDEEDFKEQQKAVSTLNLNNNKTGIFMFDSRFETMDELENKFTLLDSKQKEAIENSVFNYWGTSKQILQNTYTEDVWNAFYESHVKPFFIQLGEVLTGMFYSRNQQMTGAEINFTSDQFSYIPIKTKAEFLKDYFDRGLLTQNQVLSILNLPLVEGGDTFRIRAEYVNINQLNDVGKGVTNNDSETGNPNTNSEVQPNGANGTNKEED